MKDKILLIDDNPDLLFNLQILFENYDFDVFTATNGLDALSRLYEDKINPSLIVCDIMMPEMDGYEFFKSISKDPELNTIPFIFLTAKSSSEDVRFGKLLGIDDYLTKPFNEEDLIAIVRGKIDKRKKILEINQKFNTSSAVYASENNQNQIGNYENSILFLILWDEMQGPKLIDSFCNNPEKIGFNLEKIGTQLFQSSVSIFGFQDDVSREAILLTIKNIGKVGFILFDYYDDVEVRGNKRLFMLGVINDSISYYDSLIIEKKLSFFSEKFKITQLIDLKQCFVSLFDDNKLVMEEGKI